MRHALRVVVDNLLLLGFREIGAGHAEHGVRALFLVIEALAVREVDLANKGHIS